MKARASLLILLFLTSFIPIANADETSPVTINVDWTSEHAYVISGDVELSEINLTHIHDGMELDVDLIFDTTGENLRIIANTSLAHGDTITIDAGTVSRSVTVGLWGQPLADHEVTLNSHWEMNQQWENENGTQKYILIFNGQGWQQRIGDTLESWEMGNGSLFIVTNTADNGLSLMLDLDSVWKNETTVDGIMTGQLFDARGSGDIVVMNYADDNDVEIEGTVSDAWINRSMVNGIIDERFRLEANGTISVLSDSEDEMMNLDGELAVLLIETWDSNGTRRLSHTQFEATADLIVENNDSRMDISLDQFESLERWEDGERVDHLNRMIGHGTFGFSGDDENASVQINGTIYDFHQEQEDGIVTVDDLHVDGIITGDAQGNFGVVRTIEDSMVQENDTGAEFDVIIVHQEEWFNITGIAALPNSDLGSGAHYNESWSYDAIQADWDNRTIRTVWSQTGPDPSSGDEYHPNSPIQNEPEAPTVEEGIGDVSINRESGFAPVDAVSGDVFTLDHQDGMILTVTTGDEQTIAMDGHMVDTVAWTGIYSMNVTGFANGNLITDGPLSGLNVQINRTLQVEFGDEGQLVNLTENQSVNRVLSPSIISVHDNSDPVIESINLAQGVISNEGGVPGNIEVTVSDIDFNVDKVVANSDMIAGFELIEFNDRGLNGDRVIGDDIWTAEVVVSGLEFGELPINVTVTDIFDASDTESANITVLNQAPRLTSIELVPSMISRGEMILINAEVIDGHGVSSVSVDMREYGGNLSELNRIGDIWAGQVLIPGGISPGDHNLKIRMVDNYESAITVQRTASSGQYHIESPDDADVSIKVMNEPPLIDIGDPITVEIDDEDVEYTLTIAVEDYDGLFWVKVKLGNLAPPGKSATWYTMTSNGDGTYSKTFTIKSHIALGSHELLVKAMDTYGSQTYEESISITLEESSNTVSSSGPSSDMMTYIGLAVLGIIAIAGAAFYVMRGSDGEGGLGGFGDA
ncbi:MAG: hypothetical protein DWC02_01090 [Candidatus Poseidoniales archaeon]|nr:MAG: hypothetical protein DWC02_01090 [Candidatus Poseidoniales archaeon]